MQTWARPEGNLQPVAQAFFIVLTNHQEWLQQNRKCHEAGNAYVKFTENQPIQTSLPASSEDDNPGRSIEFCEWFPVIHESNFMF
jgi:hypothetical protein